MTGEGRHVDDGGVLTLFAGKDEILIACTGRHYWRIPAAQQELQPQGEGEDATLALPRSDLDELTDTFGPDVASALGLTEG